MKNLSLSHIDGLLSRIHLLNQVVERVAELILPKATARGGVRCPGQWCGFVFIGTCDVHCYKRGGGDCVWRYHKIIRYKYDLNPLPGCNGPYCYEEVCGQDWWYYGEPCTPCPV